MGYKLRCSAVQVSNNFAVGRIVGFRGVTGVFLVEGRSEVALVSIRNRHLERIWGVHLQYSEIE